LRQMVAYVMHVYMQKSIKKHSPLASVLFL